jgi:fructose-1,6-bisphosphatase
VSGAGPVLERVLWMVLLDAETIGVGEESLCAYDVGAWARTRLRDDYGINLDDLAVLARDVYDAKVRERQNEAEEEQRRR